MGGRDIKEQLGALFFAASGRQSGSLGEQAWQVLAAGSRKINLPISVGLVRCGWWLLSELAIQRSLYVIDKDGI